jgi:hypothetical protein
MLKAPSIMAPLCNLSYFSFIIDFVLNKKEVSIYSNSAVLGTYRQIIFFNRPKFTGTLLAMVIYFHEYVITDAKE